MYYRIVVKDAGGTAVKGFHFDTDDSEARQMQSEWAALYPSTHTVELRTLATNDLVVGGNGSKD